MAAEINNTLNVLINQRYPSLRNAFERLVETQK